MKNVVKWKDVVKVNGEYYVEIFEVEFDDSRLNKIETYLGDDEEIIINALIELENEIDGFRFDEDPLYNCDKFFDAVREKYNLDEDDDIETYMFDSIDIPEEFDIAWLGGYINGINI